MGLVKDWKVVVSYEFEQYIGDFPEEFYIYYDW